MTTVFTNGCFDLLHIGHVRHLQACRALGDRLVVGLNGDASVAARKGPGRPIIPVADRRAMLAALACVDEVCVFDEPTPDRLIRAVRPDVLALGGDWRGREIAGAEFVRSSGGRVVFTATRCESTTAIIGRILAASGVAGIHGTGAAHG